MEKTIDLERFLDWTPPKRVNTRFGQRDLLKADPTDDFWSLWKSSRPQLDKAGLSVSKDQETGKWVVMWWRSLPEAEIRQQEEKIAASKAVDLDVNLPCPDGLSYLGYQKAGIHFLGQRMATGGGALLADEQGLGKTIQAIGEINLLPDIQSVLIICPNTLKFNWRNELKRWLVRPMTIGLADSKTMPETQIVIINYDSVSKHDWSKLRTWDLIICDEAHYLKNREAKRTQTVFGHSKRVGNAMKVIKPAIPCKRKLAMTGTPILNRPMEIFSILNWIDPMKWSNGFKFGLRYCAGFQDAYGWDFTGASNLEELQRELRTSCMIRRLKMDVLKELPPKRRRVVELESGHYEESQRERDALDRIESLETDVELAKAGSLEEYKAAVERLKKAEGFLFTEMALVRHQTGKAKLEQAIDYVRNALEDGKVILFCHHVDVMRAYQAAFPDDCVMVYGDIKVEDRQKAVEAFQNNPKVRLFIGNDAAAEGLTLTAASQVIFAEGDWVPGKLAQKEDRAHRIGQKDCVIVTYLIMPGTIDAVMIRRCVSKLDVIDQALDRKLSPQQIGGGKTPGSITVTVQEMESEAPRLTEKQILAVHRALQRLARVCDGAVVEDDCGFNALDTRIGKKLAYLPQLSPKQAYLGQKIILKYHRQLGESALAEAGITLAKK